jgi:hypothetical protein
MQPLRRVQVSGLVNHQTLTHGIPCRPKSVQFNSSPKHGKVTSSLVSNTKLSLEIVARRPSSPRLTSANLELSQNTIRSQAA